MALDATPGGTTANSYVTRAEAVAYMGTHLYASAFLALTTGEQDTALMMATRLIDRLICFLGTSASTTQALRFPMVDLPSPMGGVLPSNTIPVIVKDATSELARLLAITDTTAPNEAAAQGLTKLKVGPIELGFKEMIESNTIPPSIRTLFPTAWLCPTAEETARVAEFEIL